MIRLQPTASLLPPVPVDTGRHRRAGQIHQQQLDRMHRLPELPVAQRTVARELLEEARHRVRRQLPQGSGLDLVQKRLHPSDIPTPRTLRHTFVIEQLDILLPAGWESLFSSGDVFRGHGQNSQMLEYYATCSLAC